MTIPSQENETPSFVRVIQDAIESRILDLHTALPGEIVSYSHEDQRATVQPQLKRQYRDGSSIDIPRIEDVPVLWPRSKDAFLHFPLAPGDQVLLIFVERSIDRWKAVGGSVTPSEKRRHAYSDAVAIPGFYPFSESFPVQDNEKAYLVNDRASVSLAKNGTFQFEGRGGEELMQILDEVITLCSEMRTNTIFGPLRVNEWPLFLSLSRRIKRLKGE